MASPPRTTQGFYPPLPTPWLLGLLRGIAPAVLRHGFAVEEVEVPQEDLARLKQLRNTRGVIASNHPSLTEPAVLFHVLSSAGVSTYSLVAWDTMALQGRALSWVIQHGGGYSIQRGRRDRAAMQMTQKLLVEGRRIVVFPEGQTYGLNDLLLPFQQGVAQMGFWAAEEMEKRGIREPLLVVPVAVKYQYMRPMADEIEGSLARLESGLGLTGSGVSHYDRLRHAAAAMMDRLERDQGLEPQSEASLNTRIDRLRDTLVTKLAAGLQVELPRETPVPQAVQLLGNAYDAVIYGPAGAEETEEERLERSRRAEAVRPLYADWARLKNFLAVRDGYVQQLPSAERYLDVLGRLETEVLGKSRIRGRRRARVRVGETIDLMAELPAYREAKRETVARVTATLEDRVRQLLLAMTPATQPLG